MTMFYTQTRPGMRCMVTWEYRIRMPGENRDMDDWPCFDNLTEAEEFAQAAANVAGQNCEIIALVKDSKPLVEGGDA